MNIKSVVKHLDEENVAWYMCVIDEKTICVPQEPANRHYAAILEWAEEDGNTIQEAD